MTKNEKEYTIKDIILWFLCIVFLIAAPVFGILLAVLLVWRYYRKKLKITLEIEKSTETNFEEIQEEHTDIDFQEVFDSEEFKKVQEDMK